MKPPREIRNQRLTVAQANDVIVTRFHIDTRDDIDHVRSSVVVLIWPEPEW